MTYTSTAIGQFTAGALSEADTRSTSTSTGQRLTFSYRAPTYTNQTVASTTDSNFYKQEYVIPMSELFSTRVQDAGIPINRTASGSAYVDTKTPLPAFDFGTGASPRTQSAMTSGTIAGIPLFPLLLIGGALLLTKR